MKKVQNTKSVVSKKKQEKIDHTVDHVDRASLMTEASSNNKVKLVRPQFVDATHRFGKRSGST